MGAIGLDLMRMKKTIKWVSSVLARKRRGPVAITMHHIREREFDWVQLFFLELKQRYEFIDPSHVSRRRSMSPDNLLVTFDDGLKSQKRLVDEVLDPLEIKAVFFIPTGFIGLSGIDAVAFAKERFFPESSPPDPAAGAYDAMTWEDLKNLRARGHLIGGHTHSHPKLSDLSSREQEREIIDSADILAHELGCHITHFAYPFGSLDSVNDDSLRLAGARFDICFSNVRGMLAEQSSANFVYRQNIEPGSSLNNAVAAVEGRLDWKYRGVRKKIAGFG